MAISLFEKTKMKIELPAFDRVRVLVVGDVMLDRYWHGAASRISPEAPVPVVKIAGYEERPGGAGNVALNLKALGCQVTLVSVVGDDNNADVLIHKLQEFGVACQLYRLPGFTTITKLRVIGRNQQLLRLDFEENVTPVQSRHLIPLFVEQISQADIVVFSDYAKGSLFHIPELISYARQAGVPILVDPKNADFSVYRGATIVTPNQKEFEAAVGYCSDQSELLSKGYALMREHDISALLITQGEQGMTLLEKEKGPVNLPTRAREVYDVTGAGDTVIATLAAAMAAGEPLDLAATLANIAAGLVIKKLGAVTVSVPELRRAMQRQQGSEFGVISEEELMVAIADARAHNEKIVMTNGCFDILHAGHVQYLEQAKEFGQRLIVAINDDASVSRLKGSSRPLNTLKQRAAVLSALRVVDWVVPFSEDTPERLIRRVCPDVLVKGADYRIEEIAGADYVIAEGGLVKLLPLTPDCSTSGIIEKMRKAHASVLP
jgi:D-beta-D-heptose 7-phosphate kinase/D-beta-D-heptose 1-phosphate adenosyltransferase